MAYKGYDNCQDNYEEGSYLADGLVRQEEADCWQKKNGGVYFRKVLLH